MNIIHKLSSLQRGRRRGMDMSESQAGDRTASRPTWLIWLCQFIIFFIIFFMINYFYTYKKFGGDYIRIHDFYIDDSSRRELSEEIENMIYSEDNLTFAKIVGSVIKSFNVGNYSILNDSYIAKTLTHQQTKIVVENIVKRDVIFPMRECLRSSENRRRIAEGVIPPCMERLSLGARYGTPENKVKPEISIAVINGELDRVQEKLHRLIEADVSQDLYPDFMIDIKSIADTLNNNLKFNNLYCQNHTSPEIEYEMIKECSENKISIDRSIQRVNHISDFQRINSYVVNDYRLDRPIFWVIFISALSAVCAMILNPAWRWLLHLLNPIISNS